MVHRLLFKNDGAVHAGKEGNDWQWARLWVLFRWFCVGRGCVGCDVWMLGKNFFCGFGGFRVDSEKAGGFRRMGRDKVGGVGRGWDDWGGRGGE